MSSVNFLEKLLDGVDVEWKQLGTVLSRTKGTKITAGQMRELHKEGAPIKIFAGGKTFAFFELDDLPEKDINKEPSIIVKSRGLIEFEFYEKYFSHKNEMWSYNATGKTVNIKFVFYFLKMHEPYFQSVGSRMQMPQISIPDTDKFEIPVPCPNNPKKSLEIQAEIVRILDAMTAHTAELTAELTARKKQYNYYRDKLLSFEDGGWKTLDEVCTSISAGGDLPENYSKGQIEPSSDFPYPIYANATENRGLYGFTDGYRIASEAVTISARGAKIGYHAVRDGRFTPIIRLITLVPNKNIILARFLDYALNMTPIEGTDGGIPQLTVPTVKKIIIPFPCPGDHEKSLAEQARIVAILDKFNTLTMSLTEGLPREIELRQKQYAYYRDLLLSFPKPDVEAA